MIVNAKYSRTIFEKEGYIVALFRSTSPLLNPIGQDAKYFKAKGMHLPTMKGLEYTMNGEWTFKEAKGKRDYTLDVASYDEVIPKDAAGIVKFLTTLDGVGKMTAKRIYEAFGESVFDVMDNDIDQLLNVKGIRKGTFQRIKMSWMQKSLGKELFAYLYKFNVKDSVIMQIYDEYEEFALNVVRSEPYSLTTFNGFGFVTADAIARDNAPEDDDSYLFRYERIVAAILEVIKAYEYGSRLLNSYNKKYRDHLEAGNTCIPWETLYKLSIELLQIKYSQESFKKVIIRHMSNSIMIKDITTEKGGVQTVFMRTETGIREKGIASNVARLMRNKEKLSFNLDIETADQILEDAVNSGYLFARPSDEQKMAVLSALNNQLSVITGGPGTGKTTIQRAMLYIVEKLVPDSKLLLVAPTGRAARRMSESTDHPAQTIHSALGLFTGAEDYALGVDKIDADLIIVDESSMIDTALANYLLSAASDNSRVVIVGDDKQLPSVGPGSFLRDLIDSKQVPVATLTQVFRQAKGSTIGYNAKRIIHGNENILEDDQFQIIEVEGTQNIAEKIKEVYAEKIKEYDISEVAVLSPYRKATKTTATSVNQLNDELQKIVFPDKEREALSFITGDKVMYTRNANGLTNGDIGIVTKIEKGEELSITADFDGRVVTLDGDDLNALVLAYATTIHKSQGSEYKVVILVMDPTQSLMHKRALTYTAITRAKQQLLVIGSRKSYIISIRGITADSVRQTCQKQFLIEEISGSSGQRQCASNPSKDDLQGTQIEMVLSDK